MFKIKPNLAKRLSYNVGIFKIIQKLAKNELIYLSSIIDINIILNLSGSYVL